MIPDHFTAWLTNDPGCVETDVCELTVLQDTLIGQDPTDPRAWGTDTSMDAPLFSLTSVDVRTGDIEDAVQEAEEILRHNGWTIVSDGWEPTVTSYIATVEKTAQDA